MVAIKYTKTESDYLDDLNDQLELLIDYCQQMDQGKLLYSKPMATLLRVLVHQTPGSTSLFTHLNKQRSMKFCSTSKIYSEHNDILYLVTLITPGKKAIIRDGRVIDYEYNFVPNLDRNTNHKNWITFDEWYNLPIYIVNKDSDDGLIMLEQRQGSKLVVARKDVITFFSNKDGGAHVDAKLNIDMHSLSKSLSSAAYEDIKPQSSYRPGEKYVPGIPYQNTLHAALRQITHEMILTIRKEFGLRFSYNPSHKSIIGYKIDRTYDTCVRYDPVTRQISTSN